MIRHHPWQVVSHARLSSWAHVAAILTVLTLLVLCIPRPAWSSEGAAKGNDSCLATLIASMETRRASPKIIPGEKTGRAIAAGLVLGLRAATGPVENRVLYRSAGRAAHAAYRSGLDTHAFAIADYRRCRNEQTLQSLAQY